MPPLIAAALVVLLQIVSLGAVFPTLQGYTDQLGGSALWGGLLFAAVTAPKVLLNPLWGRLSDRVGRKPALGAMFIGTIAGSVLWAMAPTLGEITGGGLLWLTISRIVIGCFTAQAAVAFAIACDIATPEKRAAAMGVLGAAFGVGLLVGIPLGGVVGDHSLAAVGWLSAGFELAALVVAMALLKETHRPADGATTPRLRDLFAVAGRHECRTLLIVTVMIWAGASVLIATLGPLTADRYGYTFREVGWVMAVWGLVGVLVQGGLIRPAVARLGERTTALVGLVLLAMGYIGLSVHQSSEQMYALMLPIGAGGALFGPTVVAMLSHRVGASEQGRLHGLNQSATSLGRAIGMFGGGALYATAGQGAPYWVAAGVVAAGAVVLLIESGKPASP